MRTNKFTLTAATSILDDGIAKIKAGLTSAEDVARAVRDRV